MSRVLQKFPKKASKHFLSDNAYSKLAQWLIVKYAPSFSQDQDMFDYVKYRLMVADSTWQRNKGASQLTHRYNYGLYSIRTYINLDKKKRNSLEPKTDSLDRPDNSYLEPTYTNNPIDFVIQEERADNLNKAMKILSQRETTVVKLRMGGDSFRTISKKVKLSYEMARLVYLDALAKLREELEDVIL